MDRKKEEAAREREEEEAAVAAGGVSAAEARDRMRRNMEVGGVLCWIDREGGRGWRVCLCMKRGRACTSVCVR